MKIKISAFCIECQEQEGHKKIESVEDILEFNDQNLYELTCKQGHKCYAKLQEQKFELLFDHGAMALIDGYSRESVASFASSLERFMEYFLKVICLKKNIPYNNFIETWKIISNQSERQLGAFYFIQLLHWGKLHYVINDKKVQFRNKVIHQGYIPTRDEAIKYGDYVLQLIFSSLLELNKTCREFIFPASFYHLIDSGDSTNHTTASIPTIINLRSIEAENYGHVSLGDALENLKSNNFYTTFYQKK